MMRCSVADCDNETDHTKYPGITFHEFPLDPVLRKEWLHALGKELLFTDDVGIICSEHFLRDDLYYTKEDGWRVRPGAVPLVVQGSSSNNQLNCLDALSMNDTSNTFVEQQGIKICRICLVGNIKIIPITKYKLEMAYEEVTGISLVGDDLPKDLCIECAQRLLNCSKFRNKSLRAYLMLMQISGTNEPLTQESINSLNRYENHLTTCLQKKIFEPDHFDLVVKYKPSTIPIEKIEVKVEEYQEPSIKDEESKKEVFIDESDKKDFINESDDNADDGGDDDVDDDNFADYLNCEMEQESDEEPIIKVKKKRDVKEKQVRTRQTTRKKINKTKTKKVAKKKGIEDDLSIFTVTELTKEEQLADIQKRQDSANYKNAIFKCTMCYKGFINEIAYEKHMTRHTDVCGKNECPVCKIRYKNLRLVRQHLTAFHTQRFSCNECSYVGMNRQNARLHQKWHKGTEYKCPHCGEVFNKFTSYMGHIRIKHPSDFVCELCGFSYVSEKGKKLHKRMTHRLENTKIPPDAPYCEPCDVRFISEEALQRHLSVSPRHNANKEKKAPNHGKFIKKPDQTIKRENVVKKMRGYTGPPIPCEQCGVELEDLKEYTVHFRKQHADKNRTFFPCKRPVMCDVCGKLFQSQVHLKDHAWVHTDEKPFKCDLCGKAFRMKARLLIHSKIHDAEKKTFPCQQCGKHFSTYANRQKHLVIHTGIRSYECEMCGKCFKHASDKRAHINYVHLKKPWPKRTRGKRTDTLMEHSAPNLNMEVDEDKDMHNQYRRAFLN